MTRPARAPSVPEPSPLPTPAEDVRQRARRGAERRDPGVVLEPGEAIETDPGRRRCHDVPDGDGDGLGHELTHAAPARAPRRVDVEQAHPGMRTTVGTGERRAQDLVPGADGQDGGASGHGRRQDAVGQSLGRLDLRSVLSAPDAVEIGAPAAAVRPTGPGRARRGCRARRRGRPAPSRCRRRRRCREGRG